MTPIFVRLLLHDVGNCKWIELSGRTETVARVHHNRLNVKCEINVRFRKLNFSLGLAEDNNGNKMCVFFSSTKLQVTFHTQSNVITSYQNENTHTKTMAIFAVYDAFLIFISHELWKILASSEYRIQSVSASYANYNKILLLFRLWLWVGFCG